MDGRKKLAVMVSGGGSNLQAIIDACKSGEINGQVVAVISSSSEAYALVRAKTNDIPAYECVLKDYNGDRVARDRAILSILKKASVDYIVLAGYLGILTDGLINAYPNRIVNIHPALLPKFGGKDYYGLKVHSAVIAAGESESGATAHFVVKEIDGGPIIRQEKLAVHKGDTAESLQQRILSTIEHPMLVSVIKDLCADKISVVNNKVIFSSND